MFYPARSYIMKKLLLFFPIFLFVLGFSVSCKFAPSQELGDTVAAKVFEPIDTAVLKQQQREKMSKAKDSVNIFIIGEGSTRDKLQLISYPSHRDTMLFGKKRPVKVTGSAEYGRVVRIVFVMGKDSTKLVKQVGEIKMDTAIAAP